MTYKEAITAAMQMLAQDDRVRFCGYNVAYGGMGGGTFKGIDPAKLIEFPLAENLMMGACIGMSLEGLIPVCFIERADFLTNCMDAIVNHLDKLARLSNGLHNPAVIIRVVIGNRVVPLFTGLTHTQPMHEAMFDLVNFPVRVMNNSRQFMPHYQDALLRASKNGESTMIFEYKDLYDRSDV